MKTIETTITCDACERDISPKITSYPHDYILRLTQEDVAICGGATYALMMSPLLERDLYFCGFGCLKKYVTEKLK